MAEEDHVHLLVCRFVFTRLVPDDAPKSRNGVVRYFLGSWGVLSEWVGQEIAGAV